MSDGGIVTAATAATEIVEENVLEIRAPRRVDEVVVLDYGGQYSQLIARRVRELGVFSELLPHHVGVEEVRRRAPRGLILSGGTTLGCAARADSQRRPSLGVRAGRAAAGSGVAGARHPGAGDLLRDAGAGAHAGR